MVDIDIKPQQKHVPIIDIVFTTGTDETIDGKRIVCSFPLPDVLMGIKNYKTVDGHRIYYQDEEESGLPENAIAIPRVMTKCNRKITKNPIYINFPVEKENSGGYAYDLGFTEDTFSISMVTKSWDEYEKLAKLVKINNGEKPATIHIGIVNNWTSFESAWETYQNTGWTPQQYTDLGMGTYDCIIRNSDATFEPGTQMISYNIECTVVYNE